MQNPFHAFNGSQLIQQAYEALQSEIDYLSVSEKRILLDTALFGALAHDGVVRKSGEPYITHPITVTRLLATQRFELPILQAGLLHDVIEDTDYGFDDISERFGGDVAKIVEGVSKIQKIKDGIKNAQTEAQEQQANSFGKLLLATIADPRVVIVKLADRLHNMQTLKFFDKPEKKVRIARETLEVYVEIAKSLGLYHFYLQLEDLAIETLFPWRSAVVLKAYQKLLENHDTIDAIRNELAPKFNDLGLKVKVVARPRHTLELLQRIKDKGSFAEAVRTKTIRLITDSEDACYRVLGRLHGLYRPIHNKFEDFISAPKSNGYQSLHTSVMRDKTVINVQIRSDGMEALSKIGIMASHYVKNADITTSHNELTAENRHRWLKRLQEMQNLTGDPLDFYQTVKKELGSQGIHVYSPQGELYDLPKGATAIDFAYAVHTAVGNHCVSARVNGVDYPLHRPLKNYQTVEIITAEHAQPNTAWLQFVVSERAKVGIKHYFRTISNREARELGEQMLNRALQQKFKDGESASRALNAYLDKEKIGRDLFLTEIGTYKRQLPLVVSAIMGQNYRANSPILTIRSASDEGVHLSSCCYPVPRDEIVGRFDADKGIIVHRKICKVSRTENLQDWLLVSWEDETAGTFIGHLTLLLNERIGLLADLARMIGDLKMSICSIQVGEVPNEPNQRLLELAVEIRQQQDLMNLIEALRPIHDVIKIVRTLR